MAKSKVVLSLFDLLKGVGKTEEKLVAKDPQIAKVPIAKRQGIEGMSPGELVNYYNTEGLLGKFRSGEPAVADIVRMPINRFDGMEEVKDWSLPRRAYIRFMGEDELKKPVADRITRGKFKMERDTDMEDALSMYPSVEKLLEEARRNPTTMQRLLDKSAVTRHLDTTDAPPDIGSQAYQLAYDMKHAQGDVGVADILTPRNMVRRPLNVGNYGLARGNYRNVAPLGDRGIGSALEQMGQRLYGSRADDSLVVQREYLKGLLGDDDMVEEILKLDPVRLAVMGISKAPEGATGYLSLLNSLRAATAGPENYRWLRETVHPGDLSTLSRLVDEDAMKDAGKSGIKGAFGPGSLGRARTAEAAVSGLRQGMTPDEIVEEITKDVPIENYYGRYAQGGGVKKYKMGGLSALQEPVVEPSPDPLVEIIMRQIGVEPGTQPTPAQLQQFNDVYNQMLERQRIKEETYDYPFREHDAVLG